MPLLHMETDLVRGAGNQLQQASGSLQQQTQQLNQSVQTLSSAWQGPSADIFVGEVQPLLQQLNQLSNAGNSLNQRLQREVDEWESMGAQLGNSGGTGIATPPVTSNDSPQGNGNINAQDEFPGSSSSLPDNTTPSSLIQRGPNGSVNITIDGQDYKFETAHYQGNTGHVYHGELQPNTEWLREELSKLGLPASDARIMALVSGHEGGFDAIQTYDRAKFSWGFVQFAGTGGLPALLTNIHNQAPDQFAQYFGQQGIAIENGHVIINKSNTTLRGDAVLQELHDNPDLWDGFLQASHDPVIQSIQVQTAYNSYYAPIMQQPVTMGGQTYTLGELARDNEFARAMLFDRSVQKGSQGAARLFQRAINRSGAQSPNDLPQILETAKSLEPTYTYRWDNISKLF